jgi:hypothetical protein
MKDACNFSYYIKVYYACIKRYKKHFNINLCNKILYLKRVRTNF